MTEHPNLNTRHQNILKATVEHYIATAEPVGSKTLAQEYNLNISSATIRNAMGHLESAGLLYQPHTSAGRIPSDSGYRIYVDRLMELDTSLSKQLERFLHRRLHWQGWSFDTLLQQVAKTLAELSGYIALVTFPQHQSNTLRHLQLVRLASGQIVLVLVTDSYQTQSMLMDVSENREKQQLQSELIEQELSMLSNFLNHKFKGRSLREIATLDWEEHNCKFEKYNDLLELLTKELTSYLQSTNSTPIAIHGVAEILHQPEFSQLQQIQTLLYLLEEEQEQLLPVVFSLPQENSLSKVMIKIGAENYLEPMQTCTLVAANYYQDETPIGSVGVIGPTRMLYDNVIALVETTADYLSETFK